MCCDRLSESSIWFRFRAHAVYDTCSLSTRCVSVLPSWASPKAPSFSAAAARCPRSCAQRRRVLARASSASSARSSARSCAGSSTSSAARCAASGAVRCARNRARTREQRRFCTGTFLRAVAASGEISNDVNSHSAFRSLSAEPRSWHSFLSLLCPQKAARAKCRGAVPWTGPPRQSAFSPHF